MSTNRECQWSATSQAPWVVLSSSEGQGEGTVQFSVASNADPAGRSTAIIINDQRTQIAQDGKPCEFTVSSHREAVDGAGGDLTVQVRSAAQCSWTASANVSWITIVSGREGRGDGSVSFRVDAVNGVSRTGTLTVAGQTVHVDQGPGCTYSLDAGTFNVDASGGERRLAVSAEHGCAWSAQSDAAWITIMSGSTGNGPGIVAFRVAATDGAARTGTLRVAGRTATIVQASGCSLSVNPVHLNAAASAGTATIQVETAAGCNWSAATGVAWLTLIGPARGEGRGQVQVAVTANVGPARTGSVIIEGRTVAIAQASGCTYSVSPAAQRIRASGGLAASSVSTANGCTWSATSAADWIAIATPSGSGSGQVAFSVAPNQGPPRTATLTIAGQVHSVTQESDCTWSFNPPSHQVEAPGGFGTVLVSVTGACTWTATSDVDWMRVVAGASGVGGGLFQFTVAPNSGSGRAGVILVAGHKYVVNQAGR